jgi:ABC-type glutathione transport system ATPase component
MSPAVYWAALALAEGGALRQAGARAAAAWGRLRGEAARAGDAEPGAAAAEPGEGEGAGEDEDVAAERRAIQEGAATPAAAAVLLDGVRRTYRPRGAAPVPAVRGVWLSVVPGECFGLLGQNGAGKTTTFRMLTGEETPDAGAAFVGGASCAGAPAAARRAAGYCPQHNAAPPQLTAREVLRLHAALRGLPGRAGGPVAARLLRALGLDDCADRWAPPPSLLPPHPHPYPPQTASAAASSSCWP